MERKSSRSKLRWLIAPLLVIGVATAGILWFLGGNAPGEVSLEETAAAVQTSAAPTAEANPTATENSAEPGLDGLWAVDTSVGEFTVVSETTASFAGFRVDEVLQSIGSTTAVGRTPAVTGTVEINGTTLTEAEIVADLTQIVSDESRRENAIQRALGTSSNPEASFHLIGPLEFGETAVDGNPVTVTASGELTINGVTNTVGIPLNAQLLDGRILVTGSIPIVFADFEITAPSAPVVVSVEDSGILELQLWLSPA